MLIDRHPDEFIREPYINRQPETNRLFTCPSEIDGYQLYPFDPSKYIDCKLFHILSCPEDHVFSISQKECQPKNFTSRYDRVRGIGELSNPGNSGLVEDILHNHTNKVKCPLEALGVFPHPFDNEKYIKCFDGQLFVKFCRKGYSFSLSQKICEETKLLPPMDVAVPGKISDIESRVTHDETPDIENDNAVSKLYWDVFNKFLNINLN